MAHTNIGWDIYERLKYLLISNIPSCEIENKYKVSEPQIDELATIGKYFRGLVLRLSTDNYNDEASAMYNERIYTYDGIVYVNAPAEGQKELTDFCENIKYVLHNNKNDTNDTWQHLRIDIEYPEPEEANNIKIARIKIEVLRDG